MKRNKIALFSFIALSLAGCSSLPSINTRIVTFSVEKSPAFILTDYQFTVNRGQDLSLNVVFNTFYSYESVDYDDIEVTKKGRYEYTFTFKNIQYPQRVHFSYFMTSSSINYNLNGGAFKNSESTDTSYLENCNKTHHLRTNTDNGERISRDGYLLTGWNTKADYSGEHYSLGSKTFVEDDAQKELYAQWVKETPAEKFTYSLNNNYVTITSCLDTSLTEVVIPQYIQDKPVTTIASNAFDGFELSRLYLSDRITSIQSQAFVNSQIESITFSDSLMEVSDDSFSSKIPSWSINAHYAPRLTSTNEIMYFSDNIDNLIINKDKKKMVFFAGCSMSYGLDSTSVVSAFPDYEVMNLGIIGGTNALFQMRIIENFLKQDDIFIHAPEQGSGYQLFNDLSSEIRMFQVLENDYDLIKYLDMTEIDGSFNTYHEYNLTRMDLEPSTYDSYISWYNSYGDNIKQRYTLGDDISHNGGLYTFDLSMSNAESLTNLTSEYQRIREKGTEVLFSFAPMNIDGISTEYINDKVPEQFEEYYTSNLTKLGYDVISQQKDYLYHGRYFYDADYHLNYYGVEIRTENLISDINGYFNQKGN